ncbi:TetR/AcrR family transcriptional regulator [Geomicrobium sp. JCM 19038]|uniref:TetR/AcrR family transcriptional regulator n=1 Tax=Geomicrobium sp. JCM 19038 TaxID=1460635 RepID=UPI00045F1CC6|nr:TetR/AcrR family transcriptional regulator [Geomicrobium sp. JCM 19038]GAK07629.1 fatty acid degradation regulator YsiA, TetR family [Geomicrobium sp. JCM 19038]
MAKRSLNNEEIYEAAEAVLLQEGYKAFHFKLLADRLQVGRSTIYEYFTNKEELVTSYMVHKMSRFYEEIKSINVHGHASERLEEIIRLLMKFTQIHLIIETTPHVNANISEKVKKNLMMLWRARNDIFQLIETAIVEGQEAGEIKQELSATMITDLIFNAVRLNQRYYDHPLEVGTLLYHVIFNGIGTEK